MHFEGELAQLSRPPAATEGNLRPSKASFFVIRKLSRKGVNGTRNSQRCRISDFENPRKWLIFSHMAVSAAMTKIRVPL